MATGTGKTGTVGKGAVIERELVKRHLQRKLREALDTNQLAADAYRGLLDWLKTQPQRTKRPGGIGR